MLWRKNDVLRPAFFSDGQHRVANLIFALEGPVCTGSVDGMPLETDDTSLKQFGGGSNLTAECSWDIPSGARGRLLTGYIAARYKRTRLVRTFSAMITD